MEPLQVPESLARRNKTKSKAAQCLELLTAGPARTGKLIETLGHRFSTAVDQLRKRGYRIDVVKCDDGQYEHRLLAAPDAPMVEVTPAMQAAYYFTEHWRHVRRLRLEYDRYRCCFCQCPVRSELEVHHWRYHLFAEELKDLITLCIPCHQELHDTENIHLHFPRFVDASIAALLLAAPPAAPEAMEWKPASRPRCSKMRHRPVHSMKGWNTWLYPVIPHTPRRTATGSDSL